MERNLSTFALTVDVEVERQEKERKGNELKRKKLKGVRKMGVLDDVQERIQ